VRDSRTGIYPAWLLLWALAAIALVFLLQPAAGWRDGPEFVDSAWVLGIAHPAGFPLYQALAWMLEQLPLADVVLRNHLFSTLFTMLAAVMLFYAALSFARILTKTEIHDLDRVYIHAAGWISLCWLAMPPQLENAIQSEAYSLHAFFTFLISKLLFDFLYTKEAKYYVLAAFLAGVGAGNHITLGVFIFALVIVLGVYRHIGDAARRASAGFVAGIWGLCVYLFLPVRSLRNPSFDWGNPESLQRFWNHVSDKKDASNHLGAAYDLTEGFVEPLIGQGLALSEWLGVAGLLLLLGGWLLLLYRHPRPALMVLSWVLFLFLFFMGWTSGTVLTGALGMLLLGFMPFVLMLAEAMHARDVWKKHVALTCFILAAGYIFLNGYHASIGFLGKRADYLPKETVESELLALPYRATVMAALPWFQLRGLADIEVMRPDVSILSLGDVISPHYFKPLEPGQIPLLNFPEIALPRTGEPDDESVSRFLQQLVHRNQDRSKFYVTIEEGFLGAFIEHIVADKGMWAAVAPYEVKQNNCVDIRDAIYSSLGRMLEENGALEDSEAVSSLKFPYYAWLYTILGKPPHCTGLASGMLRWWMRWLARSHQVPESAIYNDMGVIYVKHGYHRGARVMFQIAHDTGSTEGGMNLAHLFYAHRQYAKAAEIYRKVFLANGDAEAIRRYRDAMRQAAGADK